MNKNVVQYIQVVVLPSSVVPMVSVSPPHFDALDGWDVLMAVMRSIVVGFS